MCLKRKAKVTIHELSDVLPHTLDCLRMNNVEASKVISGLWGEDCVRQAVEIKTSKTLPDESIGNTIEIVMTNITEINDKKILLNGDDDNIDININNSIDDNISQNENKYSDIKNNSEITIQEEEFSDAPKKKKRKKSFAKKENKAENSNNFLLPNNFFTQNNFSSQNDSLSGSLSGSLGGCEIELYDRVIMADVLYHVEDYGPLILTIVNTISPKGIVVICYEQRRKNLNLFFDQIIPLFHSHERHTIEIEKDCSTELDNEEEVVNNYSTVFQLHILRSKVIRK